MATEGGFSPLGTEDANTPLVEGGEDPVPLDSQRPGSSSEGTSGSACGRKFLIISVLCCAFACLAVAGWKYRSLIGILNREQEPEKIHVAKPRAAVVAVGNKQTVKLWQEPHLDPWPLRPRLMRSLANWDYWKQECIWMTQPELVHLHPGTCKEDEAHQSFAWFPQVGKLATYWYKQCMAVEKIERVRRTRPDYCQGIQLNQEFKTVDGRRLRRNETKIPEECLEEEKMVVPLKNGTAVLMQPCSPDDPWQEWEYDDKSKQFRNKASRTCLSLHGTVHMWECHSEASTQKWNMEERWADREQLKSSLPPLPELPRDTSRGTVGERLRQTSQQDHKATCLLPNETARGQLLTYGPVVDLPWLSLAEQAHIESIQEIVVRWDKHHSDYGLVIAGKEPSHRAIVHESRHPCIVQGDVILAVNQRPASTGVHVRELMEKEGKEPILLRVYRKTWRVERLKALNSGKYDDEIDFEVDPEQEEEKEEEKVEQEGKKGRKHSNSNATAEEEEKKKEDDARISHKHIPDHAWDKLRVFLRKQIGDRAVYTIGNEDGVLFQYNAHLLDENIPIASEAKLMGATLIMRLVELGYFGLDDRLSKWLPWWPTEPTDSRSYITVRHCIAMTSGFYWIEDKKYPVAMDGRPERFNANYTNSKYTTREKRCHETNEIACAQLVLGSTQHIAPPGTIWTYSGDHLRLAVAVMVSATGTDYTLLWRRHIFHRTKLKMEHTRHYLDMKYWDPAAEVRSTPRDLQRFISAYYSERLISPSSQKVLETESVREARVRWFFGGSRPARPHGMPNFAFDVWLSNPTMYREQHSEAWCGKEQHCIFAPSFFNSVMAVDRLDWWTYNQRSCSWKYSSTCSFYFHLQNVVDDASWENNKRCKYVAGTAEDAALAILKGWQWTAPPVREF